ncbi:MAG: magnesium transporter [Gemmatimonadetes bacterium]|nr:magnesium transporter [Gemmatimonadota bacterium]
MTDPSVLVEELMRLAESGDVAAFRERAEQVHPSDLSDAFAALDEDLRVRLVRELPAGVVSEALAEMEPEERPSRVLEALSDEEAADIVDELATDDAADVIAELPPERADTILRLVDDREEIEDLLRYDEESAGGIMTTELVSVHEAATAEETIEEIRRRSEEIDDFYQVYCVSDDGKLVGVLSLRRVVGVPAYTPVRDVMEPAPVIVTPDQDQEQVARSMARYNVAAVPVVDHTGVLLGRITFDDVIDVVEAEQTEDLLKFGGAGGDETLGGGWVDAIRKRLPWLLVNLLTASMAALIIRLFQDTIEALLVLAVLGPVIAGMGGNAGTQALAVTVRRVALGLAPREHGLQIVRKELLVGLVNGLAVGLIVGAVAAMIGADRMLGFVVMLAMWGNIVVAGVAGASIPLVLEKLGLDPAVASSVFVTAFTDMFGYFLILGLATALIL